MRATELLAQAEKWLDKNDRPGREAAMRYLTSGEGKEDMEATCGTVSLKHHKAAALMKPFLKELAGMKTESEEFAVSLRFFDYAAAKLDFTYASNFAETMKEYVKCGLTIREAMLLDAADKDYTKRPFPDNDGSSLQTYYTDQLYKRDPKRFRALRDEAFSLTEEEMTIHERIRAYECMFLYAFLQPTMEWEREADFAALFRKCAFWERVAGRGAVSEATITYRYAVQEAFRHHFEKVFQPVRDDAEACRALARAERDSVVPYRYQLIALLRVGYGSDYCGELRYVSDVLTESPGPGSKFLGRDYAGKIEADVLTAFGEAYFNRCPDNVSAALESLFFCPSKKVMLRAAKIIEDHYDECKEDFKRYLAENPSPARENALAVKALVEKLADTNDDAGFASIEEVEAYAAGYKLLSPALVKKFDTSAPVYDKGRTGPVSGTLLKVILDKHFSMKDIYRNRKCDAMVAMLDRESFGRFIDGVFAAWEAADYDSKLKAAAIPYCFYTSNGNLLKLKKLCATLCAAGRHTTAAYLIPVMAMNGGKYALMIVDSIANKFQYPKARQTAKKAMEAAAEKYRIPPSVMGDLIIPDYDFGPDGTKDFPCGDETLRLTVLPGGEIEIWRGDKKLKNFPDGGGEDAKAAKKEFSALKKDVKTLLKLQSARLEYAFSTGRCWTHRNFKRLFIDHPIMRGLCAQLIFGAYDEAGTLLRAFRYGPDGTAVGADYEPVSFDGNDIIALVHPCDLSPAEAEAWRGFASDNELTPPFTQLGAALYPPAGIVRADKIDLSDYPLNMAHARKLVDRYNMTRLPIMDGGCFEGWYCETDKDGYGFDVTLDGLFAGCPVDSGKNLALGFYKNLRVDGNGYIVDYDYLDPRSVPTRLTSSVLAALAQACPGITLSQTGKPVKMPFRPYTGVLGDI